MSCISRRATLGAIVALGAAGCAADQLAPLPTPEGGRAPLPLPLPRQGFSGPLEVVTAEAVPLLPDLPGTSYRTILATTRPSRGVDVYVSAPTTDGFIRLKVYAVTPAGRHLVATGLATMSNADSGRMARRVVAARAIAQRFEVDVSLIRTGVTGITADFSVVASDEAVEAPHRVGTARLIDPNLGPGMLNISSTLPSFAPPAATIGAGHEILLSAIQTRGAAGTFSIHDCDSIGNAVPANRVWQFDITNPSPGYTVGPEILETYRFGAQAVGGCTLVIDAGAPEVAIYGR